MIKEHFQSSMHIILLVIYLNVIVGNVDEKMKKFIIKNKFSSPSIIINKMCNVKYLTEPINLFIPFGRINKAGLIENTLVHVEELLISANVKKIFYGVLEDLDKYERFSDLYEVNIEYQEVK